MKFVYILSIGAVILALGCPLYAASDAEHLRKELASRNLSLAGSNAAMQLNLSKENLLAKLKSMEERNLPRYLLEIVEEFEKNKGYLNPQETLEKVDLVCDFVHNKFSANPHPAVDRFTANKLEYKDCEAKGYSSLVILLNNCVTQPDSALVTSRTSLTDSQPASRPHGAKQGATSGQPSETNSLTASALLRGMYNRMTALGHTSAPQPVTLRMLLGDDDDDGDASSAPQATRSNISQEDTHKPVASAPVRGDGDTSTAQSQQINHAAEQTTSVNVLPPPAPRPPSKPATKPATQADKSELLASIQAGKTLRKVKVNPAKEASKGPSQESHQEEMMARVLRAKNAQKEAAKSGTALQANGSSGTQAPKAASVNSGSSLQGQAPNKSAPQTKAPQAPSSKMQNTNTAPTSRPPAATPPQAPADRPANPASPIPATRVTDKVTASTKKVRTTPAPSESTTPAPAAATSSNLVGNQRKVKTPVPASPERASLAPSTALPAADSARNIHATTTAPNTRPAPTSLWQVFSNALSSSPTTSTIPAVAVDVDDEDGTAEGTSAGSSIKIDTTAKSTAASHQESSAMGTANGVSESIATNANAKESSFSFGNIAAFCGHLWSYRPNLSLPHITIFGRSSNTSTVTGTDDEDDEDDTAKGTELTTPVTTPVGTPRGDTSKPKADISRDTSNAHSTDTGKKKDSSILTKSLALAVVVGASAWMYSIYVKRNQQGPTSAAA